jgi:hypothetical protein
MKRLGFRMLMLSLVGLACAAPMLPGKDKVIQAAAKQSDLDQPIAWLEEAKRNYGAVKDYTCTLVTQENVKGKLLDRNVIQLKIKTQPFSVHMRWLQPEKSKKQEVLFVQGKNNNKMRVKNNLIFPNIVGYVSVDVNDPRVMEHSRHTIVEAGIGSMIDQSLAQWQKDRTVGKTNVATQEYLYNNRKCIRVELTRLEKSPAFEFCRTVIYLEKESKLPIRLENYGWPRPGTPADGELMEEFSYVNLQFNVDLKDADFNK